MSLITSYPTTTGSGKPLGENLPWHPNCDACCYSRALPVTLFSTALFHRNAPNLTFDCRCDVKNLINQILQSVELKQVSP
jgi:hypothetical protein